jgi:hypothetical protein
MLWSSRQVVCTSGSIEFPDKSYYSFVASVESLATFDQIKLHPYIINNKTENLRIICNKNKKYSEEKQASLKLRLAVTMLTAFVRSYTDMHRISNHFFLVFLTQLTLENMWILNLQEIKPENMSKSLNMLFNNNGHG